ncbi:MAG: EAL domain-containing protein [Mycobacterium sp.]
MYENSLRFFFTMVQGVVLVMVGTLAGAALIVSVVVGTRTTFWLVLCVALVCIGLAAAWCTGTAARLSAGRQRAAWICQTIGVLGWAAGAAGAAAAHRTGTGWIPALAHVGFVTFWLATFLALILLPGARIERSRARLVLDAVIVGAALFEIAWLLILQAGVELHAGTDGAEVLSVAYLVATVVVITAAVLLVVRVRGQSRRVLLLLAIAVIVMSLTRAIFGQLMVNGQFDTAVLVGTGWAVGLFTIGMAAVLNTRADPESAASTIPSRSSLWLPYVPIAAAQGVATVHFLAIPEIAPALLVTLLMVAAVLARQFLVLRDNRRLVMEIAEQALHDPLTGVGNRALFDDRLTHAVHLRQRDRTPITVLVLDLDDFKFVNVSMGHPAGDTLLVDVAERLLSCLRTGDTIARLGGDEFAILLEGGVDSARAVAHRVVQCFDEPFVLDGEPVLIRPSIGLVALSGDDADVSAEVVLKRADVAMYAVKASGIGGLRVYSSDLDAPAGDSASGAGPRMGDGGTPGAAVHLLGELRLAIDRAELTVVYQPQVDLQTNTIIGLEALMRWPHPQLGLLEPDRFLPLIRQHGLMPAVTDLVLGKALDQLTRWQAQRCATRVAVNLVAPSLSDLALPSSIAAEMGRRGLPPELLTIEITEDLMLNDVRRAATVLGDLRTRGIRIAIDDFGSGYSALSYLRELPIDEMKICRQLVTPIIGDPRAEAVVRTVVDLAHVLGATVVAEGVENQATGDRLREFGCDIVQGYHYFRPLATEAVTELLRTQRRRFDNTMTG